MKPFVLWLLSSLPTRLLSLPAFHTPLVSRPSANAAPAPFPFSQVPLQCHLPGRLYSRAAPATQGLDSPRKRCPYPAGSPVPFSPLQPRPFGWACGFTHFTHFRVGARSLGPGWALSRFGGLTLPGKGQCFKDSLGGGAGDLTEGEAVPDIKLQCSLGWAR